MGRISLIRIRQLFQIGESAGTTTKQGRALEDLICYLFEKIPGITVTGRNQQNVFHTEEIDVAFWNDKYPSGLYFLPDIILVECKNWSKPVGGDEVSWFDRRLHDRGLSFGVMVASRGITGNPTHLTHAHSILAGSLREQRRIVILTRQEIEKVTHSTNLINMLKQKLCQLVLTGTSFQSISA